MVISNIHLQVDVTDRWHWLLDRCGVYSVRRVYHYLTSLQTRVHNMVLNHVLSYLL